MEILYYIVFSVCFIFILLIYIHNLNRVKKIKTNCINNNLELNYYIFNLLINSIKSLNSLYITNRDIEAYVYLNFIEEYIKHLLNTNSISKDQNILIKNNILDLKILLISLNKFRNLTQVKIDTILKELENE